VWLRGRKIKPIKTIKTIKPLNPGLPGNNVPSFYILTYRFNDLMFLMVLMVLMVLFQKNKNYPSL
jgi:hypothetical protein